MKQWVTFKLDWFQFERPCRCRDCLSQYECQLQGNFEMEARDAGNRDLK